MSKISVHCKEQLLEIEDVAGTLYLKRTSTAKDFRNQLVNHPTEVLFSMSAEEASYLADALNTVIGKSSPLQPKEATQCEVAQPTETVKGE